MKKLYVTVSNEVYELLENYLSSNCIEVVGASKSSIVDSILYSALSKTSVLENDIDSDTTPRSTFSLTGHYSNDSLFKDDKKWTT